MLEHYSYIRIDAKHQALDALHEARRCHVTISFGGIPAVR